MKKSLYNAVLCLAHLVSLVLLEAGLSATLVWADCAYRRWDIGITFATVILLGVHYTAFLSLNNRGALTAVTRYTLVIMECMICMIPSLIWIWFAIDYGTFPILQVLFVILINTSILLVRFCVNTNLAVTSS